VLDVGCGSATPPSDEAIDFLMALGPAGEILRLQGDRAAHLHDQVRDALASGLADLTTPAGVIGDASTWIISATNPARAPAPGAGSGRGRARDGG
jgi:hypothetical protein